ncbi:uncharacterized protein BO96DRAFT_335901 [Aspergillus niger CBS 101883]|uniref:Uncharacterized protein n=3 Tax=Aspergillus TaxID=5052 RepID=A2QB45_ASPNC|nr:uncharacterized protein BO96DRAFT_335901 [Aspergillus niger CBS 101883]XP_059599842.1 hypothetical protein An01g13850 [Aspergillus niger]PYH57258.1 hypothetical protein BO96DRAFT_335901 [Aspergillus niger CBS 101883]RDK43181.1 hypothetical protein M752DRAFT_326069 [Aspergillus phoenicis ATCC 13157]CAK37389.1 hypothetical protein An01g13850 [Aspergillus niger]
MGRRELVPRPNVRNLAFLDPSSGGAPTSTFVLRDTGCQQWTITLKRNMVRYFMHLNLFMDVVTSSSIAGADLQRGLPIPVTAELLHPCSQSQTPTQANGIVMQADCCEQHPTTHDGAETR